MSEGTKATKYEGPDFSRWRATIDQVGLIGAIVADLPLDEALQETNRLDTLGPILEPTAYRNGGATRVEDARALLRPLLEFQTAVRRLRSRSQPETQTEGNEP